MSDDATLSIVEPKEDDYEGPSAAFSVHRCDDSDLTSRSETTAWGSYEAAQLLTYDGAGTVLEAPVDSGKFLLGAPSFGSIGTWFCPGPFRMKPIPYPFHEFMLMVKGHVTLYDEHNRSVLDVHAGECFFIPQGFVCSWAHDGEEVQKLFVTQTGTDGREIGRPFRVLPSEAAMHAESNEVLFEHAEGAGAPPRWCFRLSRITSPPLHSTIVSPSSEPALRVFVPLCGSSLSLHAQSTADGAVQQESHSVGVGQLAIVGGGDYRLTQFSTDSPELACQFVLVELRSMKSDSV